MTESLARVDAAEPARAARALALALVAIAILGTAALLSGLLPAGTEPWTALGAGLACVCGLLGTLGQRALLRRREGDARLQALRLQAALVLGFAARLLGLLLGAGVLVAAGVKFAGIAAFAVAFAAASLVFQVCTALAMARTPLVKSPTASTQTASTLSQSTPIANPPTSGIGPGRAPVDRPTS